MVTRSAPTFNDGLSLSKKNFISSGSFFKSADASYHADGDIQMIELQRLSLNKSRATKETL